VEEKRVKKDYRRILSEAEAQGKPISSVRRIKPFNVDIDECPTCGASTAYLYSFGKDPEGYQKLQCKVCKHQWAPEGPLRKRITLLIVALIAVMLSVKISAGKALQSLSAVMITALNGSNTTADTTSELLILILKSLNVLPQVIYRLILLKAVSARF